MNPERTGRMWAYRIALALVLVAAVAAWEAWKG